MEILCKNDKRYRELAFSITGNKRDADDLVQNMYLKLMNSKKESFTDGFVYVVMNHMFIDAKRKKKKEICESDIQGYKELFVSEDCNESELLTLFKQELDNLDYISRELAIEGTYTSIRKLADKYEVNYMNVWRKQQEAKSILKHKFKDTYNKNK